MVPWRPPVTFSSSALVLLTCGRPLRETSDRGARPPFGLGAPDFGLPGLDGLGGEVCGRPCGHSGAGGLGDEVLHQAGSGGVS